MNTLSELDAEIPPSTRDAAYPVCQAMQALSASVGRSEA